MSRSSFFWFADAEIACFSAKFYVDHCVIHLHRYSPSYISLRGGGPL